MSAKYIQESSCIHCQKSLGTHNISVRVSLEGGAQVHIGVDSLYFRPGLFDEICPRNSGGHHVANQVTDIPQSFLDSVLPD